MDWQEEYENAADKERQYYDELPVEHLLSLVSDGQYGNYNTIWHSLEERATLKQAAWVLFVVLNTDEEYLTRCNCAEALLYLLGREDVMQVLAESVALSANTPDERAPHIAALKQEILQQLQV